MKRGVTGLRGYPSQFWLTFAAMLLYLASSSFVFPSLGLSMRDTLGAMIFVPISSSMVASLAPETSRGRYVGVWSLVWVGGQAVVPTTMGWAMSGLGRGSYLIVITAGFAGAALFVALRRASCSLARA